VLKLQAHHYTETTILSTHLTKERSRRNT